jgi:Cu/Ag efflux pump CusA
VQKPAAALVIDSIVTAAQLTLFVPPTCYARFGATGRL